MSAEWSGSGPLPMPIVPPPCPPLSRSRRLWHRYSLSVRKTNLVNMCIFALNALFFSFASTSVVCTDSVKSLESLAFVSFIHLERSRRVSESAADINLQASKSFPNVSNTFMTASRSRLLAHIYSCASRFVRRRQVQSGDNQPTASTDLQHLLATSVIMAPTAAPCSYMSSPTATTVPIIASRVSLPASAASVPLLSLLPPSLASQYADPSRVVLPADVERPRAPKPRLHGSRVEYVKLIQRMAALKMVDFTTESLAFRNQTVPSVSSSTLDQPTPTS
jgi:hypothetical protein